MESSKDVNDGSKSTLAQNRWDLLRQALVEKSIPETVENPASKRIFERFTDIIYWKNDPAKCEMSVHVKIPFIARGEKEELARLDLSELSENCCSDVFSIQVNRKHAVIPVDIRNLKGFDKTGRICIWPSEQILTYWVLETAIGLLDSSIHSPPRTILEIGGGFHCLAGLAFAKYSTGVQVVLTDGDEVNIEEVTCSIERNNIPSHICRAETLLWGKENFKTDMAEYFDIVIAADVVYESSNFRSLLETIAYVLRPYGSCILFNPCRDGMLTKFVALAKKCRAFSSVSVSDHYDYYIPFMIRGLVRHDQSFNHDWHFPYMVTLNKGEDYKKGEPLFDEDLESLEVPPAN